MKNSSTCVIRAESSRFRLFRLSRGRIVLGAFGPSLVDDCRCFRYNLFFSAVRRIADLRRGRIFRMSYAIIRTGGKQFAVESGQTLRVPSLEGKAGSKVDIEALVVGEGKDAKIGGGATVSATVVGHGRGEKVIVFKMKRRKQYKRTQGHRQGYTEIKIEKI